MFVAGLALLVVGAELVVRGASKLALSLGVKPLVLGITVVAIGTSAPELAIGITAAMQGSTDLAVANIAGVNILNLLFILGLSAAIIPITIHSQILKLELPFIVLSALAMITLSWNGVLSAFDGALLVLGAIIYTVILIRLSRREPKIVVDEYEDMYGEEPDVDQDNQGEAPKRIMNSVILLAGLGLTVFGANLFVEGAVGMARGLGISETVIGLTIVAMGTGTPELATTVIATIKGDRDVAVGNLVGSSIYNVLLILGITAMAAPGGIAVGRDVLLIDISLMALVALICIPVFVSGKQVTRLEGILFVSGYLVYVLSIVLLRA